MLSLNLSAKKQPVKNSAFDLVGRTLEQQRQMQKEMTPRQTPVERATEFNKLHPYERKLQIQAAPKWKQDLIVNDSIALVESLRRVEEAEEKKLKEVLRRKSWEA